MTSVPFNIAKLSLVLVSSSLLASSQAVAETGLVIKESPYPVAETSERLESVLIEKGMVLFNTIDHAAGASKAGESLPPTQVVIFGNPAVGSKLMQCNRTVAIDLPQKMLIWEDNSQTYLAFNDVAYLSDRHTLSECQAVLDQVNQALNGIADQAIQP